MKQGVLVQSGWSQLRRVTLLAATAALVACGGGDGDGSGGSTPAPAATSLAGTAAVGAPIAGGTVQVRCAGGNVLESTTNASGTWKVDTTGQTLPCAVRVTGGSLAAGQAYHSIALSFDTLNITPLTDLIVANATGKLPATWWGGTGPTDLAGLTPASVEKALTALRTALGLQVLQTFDPRTVVFAATPKDKVDDVLEALWQALSTLGMDYAALVSAASNTSFTLSDGFRITLGNAHTTITVGGSGTGGGTGGTGNGGNYTLTLNVNAGGVTAPPVTITNVPKPATQAEFCSDIASTSSGIGLSQTVQGGSGTLTINSCSFSGNTGNVSATLAITSPVAMTVPYTVTYTYH
ncbi:hypothetical protein [Acidovorax sp.]|uniref:hypothetical protein n=1 Tax=Acidovorax sp. TaxID=1872122 RepID=UPI002611D372|nr:hypothetical protein [Acidovorax sp.]